MSVAYSVFFAVGFLFDQGDEAAQGAALVGVQLQTRVSCDSEEERHHVFRVDIEVAQELGGDNQHVALEVARRARFMSLDDVFGPKTKSESLRRQYSCRLSDPWPRLPYRRR